MTTQFYILAAGDLAGETAQGPYSEAKARILATAAPTAKIVSEDELNALRTQPLAAPEAISAEDLTELAQAARGFLYAIDHITPEAFALGAERTERERLRNILARVLRMAEEEVTTGRGSEQETGG